MELLEAILLLVVIIGGFIATITIPSAFVGWRDRRRTARLGLGTTPLPPSRPITARDHRKETHQ